MHAPILTVDDVALMSEYRGMHGEHVKFADLETCLPGLTSSDQLERAEEVPRTVVVERGGN